MTFEAGSFKSKKTTQHYELVNEQNSAGDDNIRRTITYGTTSTTSEYTRFPLSFCQNKSQTCYLETMQQWSIQQQSSSIPSATNRLMVHSCNRNRNNANRNIKSTLGIQLRVVIVFLSLVVSAINSNNSSSNNKVVSFGSVSAFSQDYSLLPLSRTKSQPKWLVGQQQRRKEEAMILPRVMDSRCYNLLSSSTNLAANANPNNGVGGDFGELTSALVRLDQQWQIEQETNRKNNNKPKWSKLMLPHRDNDDENESNKTHREEVQQQQTDDEFVWMLEPPPNTFANMSPSCAIVLVGGAGLGQLPQVCYNELLSELSTKLNAICLTVPYQVGLDHFSLSKLTGERLRRGLEVLEEKYDRDNENDVNQDQGSRSRARLPKFVLAHSLGCKLQTIYLSALGNLFQDSFDGVGFLAYNNFSFAKTIAMARTFAQELQTTGGGDATAAAASDDGVGDTDQLFNTLFGLAENLVGAMGVEFSPNPSDTDRLVSLRYNTKLQQKTRIFCFEDDPLDSSIGFRNACNDFKNRNDENDNEAGNVLQVSRLPGGHLTPILFQWDANDVARGAPPDVFEMAQEMMGGLRGASFGDVKSFERLVDEIQDWILGKPPTYSSMIMESGSSNNGNDQSGGAERDE